MKIRYGFFSRLKLKQEFDLNCEYIKTLKVASQNAVVLSPTLCYAISFSKGLDTIRLVNEKGRIPKEVDISSDGKWVLCRFSKSTKIYDIASKEWIQTIPMPRKFEIYRPEFISFHANKKLVHFRGKRGNQGIYHLDYQRFTKQFKLIKPSMIEDFKFNKKGDKIYLASRSGLRSLDLTKGRIEHLIQGELYPFQIQVLENENIAYYTRHKLFIYDVQQKKSNEILEIKEDIDQFYINKAATQAVIRTDDNGIIKFDFATKTQTKFQLPSEDVLTFDVSENEKYLAVVMSFSKGALLYNYQTGEKIREFIGPKYIHKIPRTKDMSLAYYKTLPNVKIYEKRFTCMLLQL